MRCHIIVLLLLAVATFCTLIHAQSQGCSILTDEEIKEGIENMLESKLGEGNQVITITLHDYTYTCLSTGITKDTYLWMAFVSNYTHDDEINLQMLSIQYALISKL